MNTKGTYNICILAAIRILKYNEEDSLCTVSQDGVMLLSTKHQNIYF